MNLTSYKDKEVEVLVNTPIYFASTQSKPKDQPGSKVLTETSHIFSGIEGMCTAATKDVITVEQTERSYTHKFEIQRAHIVAIKTTRLSAVGRSQQERMTKYHQEKRKTKSK